MLERQRPKQNILGYLNIEEFGELRSRYIVLGKRINALIGSLKKKFIY